jgi:hypothetical protein
VGMAAHFNRRRKAMREWLRKWGPLLKGEGYQVDVSLTAPFIPAFFINPIPPQAGDDDATAQFE